MSHSSTVKTIRQGPARIVELVGPAGAGKTTVTRTLLQYSTKVKVAPDISLRRPKHLAISALSVPLSLPVLWPGTHNGRWFTRDEFKSLIYLKTWPRVLTQQAANNRGAILLDQGPVFRLATLHAFGPEDIRKPAAVTWWNKMFKLWAPVLDIVIWLDAPNTVLEQRINTRTRWHLVKGKSKQDTSQFLDWYRISYHEVLTRLSANGGPRLIKFDTSQTSTPEVVNAVLDACNLKPEQD